MKYASKYASVALLFTSCVSLATVHIETKVSLYESENAVVENVIEEVFNFDIEYGHSIEKTVGDIRIISLLNPIDENSFKTEFKVYIKDELVSSPVLIGKFGEKAKISVGQENRSGSAKDFSLSFIATLIEKE